MIKTIVDIQKLNELLSVDSDMVGELHTRDLLLQYEVYRNFIVIEFKDMYFTYFAPKCGSRLKNVSLPFLSGYLLLLWEELMLRTLQFLISNVGSKMWIVDRHYLFSSVFHMSWIYLMSFWNTLMLINHWYVRKVIQLSLRKYIGIARHSSSQNQI